MKKSTLRSLMALSLGVAVLAVWAIASGGEPRSGWATDDRARVRAPTKAIHCGQLLDVRQRQVRRNVTILINGERIVEIRSGRVRPRDADAIIDLHDQVCAPGIMDMHLHLTASPIRTGETDRPEDHFHFTVAETALGLAHARETLYSGVTTIRSPGEHLPNRASVYMNEAIEKWEHPGPRIYLASHQIGRDYARELVVGAGDRYYEKRKRNNIFYEPTKSGDDVRQAVRNALAHGEEWVKVTVDIGGPLTTMEHHNLWTFEELQAMADETHKLGRKITGHIETDEWTRKAVLAGFDSVEHAHIPSRETLDLMKERRVYWSTTLVDLTLGHDATDPLIGADEPLSRSKDVRPQMAARDEAFRYAYSIGVPMVYASDGWFNPSNHRGRMVLEFSEYLALGVTPWDLLTIATLNPAAMLGESDNLGSIDPGKYADIIAMPRNPLADITAFSRVNFVMKGGNVVRDDLHRSPLPDVFAMQMPDVTYVVRDPKALFTPDNLVCTGRDCNPQSGVARR